jgi:hypothetical protein
MSEEKPARRPSARKTPSSSSSAARGGARETVGSVARATPLRLPYATPSQQVVARTPMAHRVGDGDANAQETVQLLGHYMDVTAPESTPTPASDKKRSAAAAALAGAGAGAGAGPPPVPGSAGKVS